MKFLLINLIRKMPLMFIGFLPIYLIAYMTKEPFSFLIQRLLFFRQGGTFLLSFLSFYHLFVLYMGVGEIIDVQKRLKTEWVIRMGDKKVFIKQGLVVILLSCLLFSILFFSIGLVSQTFDYSVVISSMRVTIALYFLYLIAIYFYSLLFYYLSMVMTIEKSLTIISLGILALILFNPTGLLINIVKSNIPWWGVALNIYILGIFILIGNSLKKGIKMEVTDGN